MPFFTLLGRDTLTTEDPVQEVVHYYRLEIWRDKADRIPISDGLGLAKYLFLNKKLVIHRVL